MLRRLAAALLVLAMAATFAVAQKKDKAPKEKTVTGIVSDEAGAPIAGAIVQLKNMKTLQVRSFIAREKGDYYFNGLSADVDWELKAQSNGKESAPRRISTFDSHMELTLNFTVK